MKLIELATPGDIGDLMARREQPGRSQGTHVSDLIRYLENTVTKPGERPSRSQMSKEELRRMGNYASMGWAWERIIRYALSEVWAYNEDRYYSPGEVERDGVIGSPDWLDLEDDCVEEFKSTWKSSRRNIETDFWSWWVQIKAYCYMLNVGTGRLRVFFVNGDYKSSGPQIRMWNAEFTERELENNWSMLLQAEKEMQGGSHKK